MRLEVESCDWTLEGNTIGKVGVSRALKPELTGAPVRFAMGVKKDKRNHSQADKRFRKTKTGSIKTPKLMTLVPGYENLFEMSIQALHPVGGDGSFAFMELKSGVIGSYSKALVPAGMISASRITGITFLVVNGLGLLRRRVCVTGVLTTSGIPM